MRIGYASVGAALLGGAMAANAVAQEYPARSVRLIIPFATGGSNDILGRLIAMHLTESLGQQVVVDNRGGAGGSIGVELAAKSPPDGYTIVIGHIGTFAVNPTLYRKLAYDPIKDFQPISLLAKVPNIMVVHPSVPAKSVQELIALAKAKPGSLVYGSGGNGGAGHLATEYFKLLTKVDLVHVPYKGTGPAIIDLLAGQTQLVFAGVPGYEATQWYGVLAPAGVAKPIVSRLNQDILKALQTTQMQERLAADGAEPLPSTPEDFQAFIKAEIARWAPVIKAAAIRAD